MDIEQLNVKRVAIYARVSTEEQAEHGYSIDAQKEALTQYCNLYGNKIVDEYVDAGVSGKEMSKRLELQRLLKDAEQGKFDEVLVWKINRMSRNTKDLLDIVDKLKKNGVDFTSLSEKFDTSGPMGRFALQMLAAVGELERNTIVENVKLGLKQRARMGLHSGSRALGYRVVPSNGGKSNKNDLVIVEDEAVIVRKIFELFCNGKGFKAIANQLNHEGYKTVKGNSFSLWSIREIIDNPLYKGYVRYCRYENWSEKRRKGKNTKPILVKGHHEAIVTEDVWEKAAKIRDIRGTDTAKVYGSANVLSSILRCPECGSPMVIGRSSNRMPDGSVKRYRFYTCSLFKNKGSTVCHSNSVNADKAETYVIEQLVKFLSNPELIQQVFDNIKAKAERSIDVHKSELDAIEVKLAEISQRKAKLVDLYVDGTFDKDMLDKRMLELNKTIDQLNALKDSIIGENKLHSDGINSDFVKTVMVNFNEVMKSAPAEQKHLLLKLLIDKITVKDHRVEKIHLKFGGELEEYINGVCPPANKMVGGLFLSADGIADSALTEIIIEI